MRLPKLYSYALMRGDLQMSPGKLAAQAAHCACQTLVEYLCAQPDREHVEYFQKHGWTGTRIILLADSEAQILETFKAAKARGLPAALFYDSGHIMLPHFDGSRILTGLGIGPCLKSEVSDLTMQYRLA